MAEQISQLKRSLLELNNQIEQLRADIARLRGQDEQLARDVAELQRQQKDIAAGRRRAHPQDRAAEGVGRRQGVHRRPRREAPATTRRWRCLRSGDFAGRGGRACRRSCGAIRPAAIASRRCSGSATRSTASATTRTRSRRSARSCAAAPDHARAPEALLSIANCQIELKDTEGARAARSTSW